jgi:hypothetical protein
MNSKIRTATFVFSASALLAVAPYSVDLGKSGLIVGSHLAWAKDGHGGGGGSGGSGSGSGGSGSGSSGSGSDGSGSGRSSAGASGSAGDSAGRHGADDGAGHAGRHGADDRGADNRGRVRGNDDPPGDDRRADHHVNPATGARVEINGNDIEVVHADGTKEEVENGRFEQKNAAGRTVVERRATAADIARLRASGG